MFFLELIFVLLISIENLLGQTKNGDKYFIDLISIQKNKQMRSYIRLRDYAIADSNGENSSIIFIETNCNDQTTRFLKDVYFKGNMAQGEYVVLEKRAIGRNLNLDR